MEVDQLSSLDDMVNLKRQSVSKALQQSSIVKTQNEDVWMEEDEDDEAMF